MEPRKYQVGDKVRDWQGRAGTVDKVQTIINEVAPHHRLRIAVDSNPFLWAEGAEYNFTPAA